jgi:hypothetical protein
VQEARERNAKALKLYQEEGAVDAALAEIERAYELAPSYKLLYNLGQIARTARDYALALEAYERYLGELGNEVPDKRRREVQAEIKELRTYVATLDIRVSSPGAQVLVDDTPVGTSPLADKVTVNAGRVRVRATLGSQQHTELVIVPGGVELPVELKLSEGEPPVAVTPSSGPDANDATGAAPAPPESPTMSPYLWIGFGAAALLGAGAAVTGGLALSGSSDVEATRFAGAAPPDDLTSKQDSVRSLAITTDVLIAAASAALVVTVSLAIAGVGNEDEATSAPSSANGGAKSAWTVVPWLAGQPADLGALPPSGPVGAGLRVGRSW